MEIAGTGNIIYIKSVSSAANEEDAKEFFGKYDGVVRVEYRLYPTSLDQRYLLVEFKSSWVRKYTRNGWRRHKNYTRDGWRRHKIYTRNRWRRHKNYTRNECSFQGVAEAHNHNGEMFMNVPMEITVRAPDGSDPMEAARKNLAAISGEVFWETKTVF
jgi:hypothetical protein